MGVTDDDKPWAQPDPPTALDAASLREGRLQTNFFLFLMAIVVAIWMYRKFVKRDRNAFFSVAPAVPTMSEETKISEEKLQISREARLKRFQEQKGSYADIMAEAAGGWTPGNDKPVHSSDDDDDDDGDGGGGAVAAASEGLRHRGDKGGD
ncbi:unnamed protein product [Laminaria digitata]